MCPDTELLSAYYDEELDRVWETRIAEHVSQCAACQARLAHFSDLTSHLRDLENFDMQASMTRSWEVIQAATGKRTVALWKRKIAVPVPVLAAAAAVLVCVFGISIYFNVSGSPARQSAAPIAMQPQTEMSPVDFQVNNLNDLLNYLNSKDLGTNVTIQLPKGVDQLSVGKPQLIRAADFNRGQ